MREGVYAHRKASAKSHISSAIGSSSPMSSAVPIFGCKPNAKSIDENPLPASPAVMDGWMDR